LKESYHWLRKKEAATDPGTGRMQNNFKMQTTTWKVIKEINAEENQRSLTRSKLLKTEALAQAQWLTAVSQLLWKPTSGGLWLETSPGEKRFPISPKIGWKK
jgi:hypothetical protein